MKQFAEILKNPEKHYTSMRPQSEQIEKIPKKVEKKWEKSGKKSGKEVGNRARSECDEREVAPAALGECFMA